MQVSVHCERAGLPVARQVRKSARSKARPARDQAGGQVALQPHQLGDLHLRRHGAADVGEDAVAGGRACLGLGDGAVVEPEDGVPAVVAGGRDGDRAALGVAEDERAGGVEGEAGDLLGAGGGLGAGGAERRRRRPARSGRRTARRGRRAVVDRRSEARRGRAGGRRRRRCRRGRCRCRRRWRRRGASSGRVAAVGPVAPRARVRSAPRHEARGEARACRR